jgi:choline dehydrogenase-like flavoprotein
MFNGVGGSTILWAAQWPRMRPDDFRVRSTDGVADDWPIGYDDLASFYERAERDLGVSGLEGDPAYPEGFCPPMPPLPLNDISKRVARAHNDLGWHWWPGYNAIASRQYGALNACVQTGTCGWGCPNRSKASTDLTHWPRALELGVTLIPKARVAAVTTDKRGLATGATYFDEAGVERHLAAKTVVLAANGLGTPKVLLQSASAVFPEGLGNSSGLVGKRLMMHPFATVVGLFDEEFPSWKAHWGQSVQSMQFYKSDSSRGFVRGAKWGLQPTGGPLLAALAEAELGPGTLKRVADWIGHSVMWGIIAEDLPEDTNQVTLSTTSRDQFGLPGIDVSYRLSENTRRLLAFHCARAEESLRAAGATDVLITSPVRDTGWHLMGTARMGDDPATSVVDRWGRCHDTPNLFVVDGSVFVTSGGVNPTSTISANAYRCATRMVEKRAEQVVSL